MTTKNHIIVGTMIGGILLAATISPLRALALSNSSSSTPTTTTKQPSNDTSGNPLKSTGQQSGKYSNKGSKGGGSSSGSPNSPSNDKSTDPKSGTDPSSTSPSSTTPSTTGSSTASDTTPDSTTPTDTSDSTQQPGSSTPASSTDPSDTSTQNSTNNTATNNNSGIAKSGDVNVNGNVSAGDATSGNASDTDTSINSLNSTSGIAATGGLQTFTYNIDGNTNGNIVLNPVDILPTTTPAASQQNAASGTINNQTGNTINNTINLGATSGNVSAVGNDSVGNATSGAADTNATIVNLISSVEDDSNAFLGIININGNLNGNILLPSSFVNEVLAQAPSNTTTTAKGTSTSSNNLRVNNNVTLNAQTGGVSVEGNGSAGNATSGDASTNLKLYNLTNSDIVGGNVLLVFVNVMGNWVGLLMNAPAGSTTTGLGGGITQDSAIPATNTSNSSEETINNNVNLNSKSGNVGVKGNASAGNATSGNASANADIVNIMGSQIDLTGWLGILVINVYGSWNGSLEVQPAATTVTVTGSVNTHHPKAKPITHHKHTTTSGITNNLLAAFPAYDPIPTPPATIIANPGHVLGDSTVKNLVSSGKNIASTLDAKHQSNKNSVVEFTLLICAIVASGAVGASKLVRVRRKKI